RGHRRPRVHDGPPRAARVDREAAGDRRAAAARAGPPAAPHQQRARRPHLHRRPRARREGAVAARPPVRLPGVGPAARHARPHPGGERPARRGEPRDGQQGARRLRPPRLAAAGGQERADPRARAARAPRPLAGTRTTRTAPPRAVPFVRLPLNFWYGSTRMCDPGAMSSSASSSASLADYRAALTAPGAAVPVLASAVGRFPIAMLPLATLLYVQRATGSFAAAGVVSAGQMIGVAAGSV